MCLTGLQDVEVFHHATMEAVVGQNVTIPCTVKNTTLQIVSIEWQKKINENTKLVVYGPGLGIHRFWPNVSIQVENSSMGSLLLYGVTKWSDGSYICDLTTFPLGSIRRQTELKVLGKMEEHACKALITQHNQTLQSSLDLTLG